jgi:hypothetical protein
VTPERLPSPVRGPDTPRAAGAAVRGSADPADPHRLEPDDLQYLPQRRAVPLLGHPARKSSMAATGVLNHRVSGVSLQSR